MSYTQTPTMPEIDYDEKYDVMYCTLSDTNNSYGDEIDKNIILLRDMDSEQITGITIYGYKDFLMNDTPKAVHCSTGVVKGRRKE